MVRMPTHAMAVVAAALVATLVGPVLTSARPATGAPALDPGTWPGRLTGVSTVSSRHAWAVGYDYSSGVLLYWNGSQWHESSLDLPGRSSELDAVDARTANDIWAVGTFFPDGSSREVSLIEHWDGTGWHRESAPGPTRYLTSVSADSATDAWAAGFGPHGAVLLHWDGEHWTSARNKGCGVCTIRGLRAVTAISPTDAWAVGYTGGRSTSFLTMHWNGHSWRRVPGALPPQETTGAELQAVSATSPSDVWAVGNYTTAAPALRFHAFFEHWDGRAWTQVAVPASQEHGPAVLYGVSATSDSDAWTAGYRLRPSRTVTDHWDGEEWTEVASPDAGLLFAVDASSSSNAFAVGGQASHTLIERWDGQTWSVS